MRPIALRMILSTLAINGRRIAATESRISCIASSTYVASPAPPITSRYARMLPGESINLDSWILKSPSVTSVSAVITKPSGHKKPAISVMRFLIGSRQCGFGMMRKRGFGVEHTSRHPARASRLFIFKLDHYQDFIIARDPEACHARIATDHDAAGLLSVDQVGLISSHHVRL